MKKLIHKIHKWLYEYHRAKMFKYHFKMLGATRYHSYDLWHKKTKLSKDEKNYIKSDLNALYGMAVYADTDSLR